MKIINKNFANRELNFPVVGLQSIDSEGIVEITDENVAESIIASEMGWSNVDAKKEIEANKKSEDDEESEEQKQIKEAINSLQNLPLETLVEMAKTSGYPEIEWEKLSKNAKSADKLMIGYLSKKIKEA